MIQSKNKVNLFVTLLFFIFSLAFSLVIGPKPEKSLHQISGTATAPVQDNSLYENWPALEMKKDISLEKSMAVLDRVKPWGGGPAQTSAVVHNPFKFRGVILSGQTYFALIEMDGKVKRYKTGDELITGERLLEIGEDFIQIVKESEVFAFKLYE